MKIRSQKDFYAGMMFMGVGGAFAWGATSYRVGLADRMGPGYFPLLVGGLMALLGVAIALKALFTDSPEGDRIGPWAWRPLAFVLGANLVFGMLLGGLPSIGLPAAGMVVAIYALTVIASLAGRRFNLRAVMILATVLAVGSYLAFIVLLKLQIRVWPVFFTGGH